AAVQLGAGATMQRAAAGQAEAATRAGFAVTGTTADRVRDVPGVAAATDVLRSTVVLAHEEAGEPRLDRLPALGVDARGLAGTLDPGVVTGDLAGLARPGTVALGADRADALDARPGSVVTLRHGDGTEARLRVVAVYERALALGEFLLPAADLARHMTDPFPARVLVAQRPGADPAAVRAGLAALGAVQPGPRPTPERAVRDGEELNRLVSTAVVAAVGGLTVIAVLSTLVLVTLGRRDEFALLGRVGAARSQVRRMLRVEAAVVTGTGLLLGAAVGALPLTAFAVSMAGTAPYLPSPEAAAIVATVAATAYAGVLLPAKQGRFVRS
ncbi:ABC transporter permease, partial [Streptomyces sp.]|uniref:ABC transporter permease n=1 Tax=Streptomyces sp. TaxID=1931 RepID=UPI002F948272